MTTAAPTGPLFDLHARLSPVAGALEALLHTMDATGISRAALAAGGTVDLDRLSAQILYGGYTEAVPDNDAVLAACARSAGRLVPFYFASPHQDPEVYRRQADRFRGLELSPAVHGVGLDDPRVDALVAIAASPGHPVYVVCLGRAGAGAADLVRLAARYRGTTFVFGHCGVIGIDAYGIAQVAPAVNIVAETSGCLTAVTRLAVERLGADRVLFGTEYPLQHPTVELAKYAALALPEESWGRIAWHNAHRLLGEESPGHRPARCPSSASGAPSPNWRRCRTSGWPRLVRPRPGRRSTSAGWAGYPAPAGNCSPCR